MRRSLLALTALLIVACSSSPPVGEETTTTAPTSATPEPAPPRFSLDEIGTADAITPPRLDYRRETLDNGLTLVTLQDSSAPIVAVHVWYHVGSKDERPDRRGFAHLFEHMMFRGTPRLKAAEHMEYIRASGGSVNAYTSFDETVYVQEVPADQLEMVLWLESERMGFLRIDETGFHKERDVVAEEYHSTAEQPYGTVGEKLLPEIFDGGTYSWLPIGDLEELGQSTVPELQAFWETYYVPNNATLVVVGDIEHDQVLELTHRYFGWIPRYDEKPELNVGVAPAQTSAELIAIDEKSGPVPLVGIGYRTVPAGHPDEIALSLAATILGGGESSRLYRRIVVQDDLGAYALAASLNLELDGIFGAGAVLAPLMSDEDAAVAAVREEIARLRDDGPTAEELRKARNQALAGAIEGQLTVASKARILGRAEVVYGDVELANREIEAIQNTSVEDIKRVLGTWLTPEREMEIRIHPSMLGFLLGGGGSEGQGKADAEEEDGDAEKKGKAHKNKKKKKKKSRENAETRDWGKPGLVRPDGLGDVPPLTPSSALSTDWLTKGASGALEHTLENGLRVVIIENHEVPTVSLSLGIFYGAANDPGEAPGTAFMATSMLTRGTDSFDYDTLTDALGVRAIDIGAGADMDDAWVEASFASTELDAGLTLFASVVREPSFEDEQLELLRGQLRAGRAIAEQSPDYIANRELRKRLYGEHPYAREATPTIAELDAITAPHLRTWWADHARPETSILYVAGDVDPEAVKSAIDSVFADWSAAGSETAPVHATPTTVGAAPEAITATRIYLVDRPAADQAQIRVAAPGITRTHPDWGRARVLNQIYGGGGLSSWLNERIRGKEGLTYGAYGGFNTGHLAGAFRVSTFSQIDSTAQVVRIILEETERLTTTPPCPTRSRPRAAISSAASRSPTRPRRRSWRSAGSSTPRGSGRLHGDARREHPGRDTRGCAAHCNRADRPGAAHDRGRRSGGDTPPAARGHRPHDARRTVSEKVV